MPGSRTKSNPHSPVRLSAWTMFAAVSAIAGWCTTLSTVAGPVGRVLTTTSAETAATTSPSRQATATLPGRPDTYAWMLTAGWRPLSRSRSDQGDRSTTSRFSTRVTFGGVLSCRQAGATSSASSTISTPRPPQLPSVFMTTGPSWRRCHDVASADVVTGDVGGAQRPRVAAISISAARE